jgi:hypothetical protein
MDRMRRHFFLLVSASGLAVVDEAKSRRSTKKRTCYAKKT